MQLEIPEDCYIQVLVGRAPRPQAAADAPPAALPAQRDRPRLKAAVCVFALGAAFVGGKQWAAAPSGAPAARAAARAAAPAAAPAPRLSAPSIPQATFPERPALRPEPTASGDVPPAFMQQLQTPPVVTPPPDRDGPGRNPFGLDD